MNNNIENLVVVLNDGETFTSITGATILSIPDNIDEGDVDTFVKDNAEDSGWPIDDLFRISTWVDASGAVRYTTPP